MNTLLKATVCGASVLAFCAAPVLAYSEASSQASSQASSYSGGMIFDNSWWGPREYNINVNVPPQQIVTESPTWDYGPVFFFTPPARRQQGFARVIPRAQPEIPYRTIKWQREMEAKWRSSQQL